MRSNMSIQDSPETANAVPKSLAQEILDTMLVELRSKGAFDQDALDGLRGWMDAGDYKDKQALKAKLTPTPVNDADSEA